MADSKSDAACLPGPMGVDDKTPKPDKKRPNIAVSPCSPSIEDGDGKLSDPDPMIVIMEELRLTREEVRQARKEMKENRKEASETKAFRKYVTDELKNLKSNIKETMTELTNKMKIDVTQEIKDEIKKELKKQDSKIETISKKIDKNSTENVKIQAAVENINSKMEKQNEKIKKLQKQAIDKDARERQNNLMFYGVKEEDGEDTNNVITNFIKKEIKLDKKIVYESCRRVGPPKKKSDIGRKASSPRPILVKFKEKEDKTLIKKESKILKPPYGCSNDLPQAVRKARSSLTSEFNTLKDQKKDVTYEVECLECGRKYLRETSRNGFVHGLEHKTALHCKDPKSTLYQHCREKNMVVRLYHSK